MESFTAYLWRYNPFLLASFFEIAEFTYSFSLEWNLMNYFYFTPCVAFMLQYKLFICFVLICFVYVLLTRQNFSRSKTTQENWNIVWFLGFNFYFEFSSCIALAVFCFGLEICSIQYTLENICLFQNAGKCTRLYVLSFQWFLIFKVSFFIKKIKVVRLAFSFGNFYVLSTKR